MGYNFNFGLALLTLALIAALFGWAVIEGIIWLIKHVSIHVG